MWQSVSIYYGACAFKFNNSSIIVKLYVNLVKIGNSITVGKVSSIHVVLRGLFEGAQYNSEAGVTRAVNSRARTKQGR